MPATFQGTSFLVTFSQSSLNKEALSAFFLALPSITYLKIAEERHLENGIHFHILALFGSKQRFGPRRLDVNGEHPNIEPVGRRTIDWDRVSTYCSKEDQSPFEWGVPRHAGSVWTSIAAASSREEAQALLLGEKPRDAVLNARNFDYFLDKVRFYNSHSEPHASPTPTYLIVDVPNAGPSIGWTPLL